MRRCLNSASSLAIVAVMILTVGGCAKVIVRHPRVYDAGRPDWSFDENRIREETELEKHALLIEELKDPEAYYFFLGTQTQFVKTEENARQGAFLDAMNTFRTFLEMEGKIEFKDNRGMGFRRFKSNMEGFSDTVTRQLKPVRWYLEEERDLSWGFLSWVLPKSKWRAWCIASISRKRSDEIYRAMSDYSIDKIRSNPEVPKASYTQKTSISPSDEREEMRTWTTSRSIKFEAEVIDYKNHIVSFRRKDGRLIKVFIYKLSDEDQAYVQTIEESQSNKFEFVRIGDQSSLH